MLVPKVSVVLSEGSSIASALAHRLSTMGSTCQLRSNLRLQSWDGLNDVCRGADVVFLLSTLDLESRSDPAELQRFGSDVNRVLECCQSCGVGGLVFTSSSDVVSGDGVLDMADENQPFVTEEEDETAYAVAMAEAQVLKASGARGLSGSSCLYTCALRPSIVYGPEENRSLKRALSWVGWGLNRLAVGPSDVRRDMVYAENVVEAHILAASKLHAASVGGGRAQWGRADPICSGQAYFVTDGKPTNPQLFLDDILDSLDFPTRKILRLPSACARLIAFLAEAACKAGIVKEPVLSQAEVRQLTKSRTLSIDRARKDLGYEPKVEPGTGMRITAESLKRDGWGKHQILVPSVLYWITNPGGIYLATLSGFGGPCPEAVMPLTRTMQSLGLLLFRHVTVVQAICYLAYAIHVAEGVYAYRLAQRAGHRDTAPIWGLQAFFLGFPSLILLRQLVL